ncbi:MAG TPA: DUF742 domain-containing protein [Pseudonocardiaceae bacterium]|jgi:hypothetical protein|nr:DUF742 domain-containing protein [Pseudonocardiaceae bacterium]
MSEGQHRTDRRHAEGPVVGLTGARFGGATGRRLRQAEPEVDPSQPHDARPDPDHQSPPDRQPLRGVSEPGYEELADECPAVGDETDWEGLEETYDLVRPYSWTGGRTSSAQDLALEALISATGQVPDTTVNPEHHAILRLCGTPRSVAELAALLSVPLGVARVVLGDMAAAGSVVVHRTASSADGAPDLALMQRVLSCLQRL